MMFLSRIINFFKASIVPVLHAFSFRPAFNMQLDPPSAKPQSGGRDSTNDSFKVTQDLFPATKVSNLVSVVAHPHLDDGSSFTTSDSFFALIVILFSSWILATIILSSRKVRQLETEKRSTTKTEKHERRRVPHKRRQESMVRKTQLKRRSHPSSSVTTSKQNFVATQIGYSFNFGQKIDSSKASIERSTPEVASFDRFVDRNWQYVDIEEAKESSSVLVTNPAAYYDLTLPTLDLIDHRVDIKEYLDGKYKDGWEIFDDLKGASFSTLYKQLLEMSKLQDLQLQSEIKKEVELYITNETPNGISKLRKILAYDFGGGEVTQDDTFSIARVMEAYRKGIGAFLIKHIQENYYSCNSAATIVLIKDYFTYSKNSHSDILLFNACLRLFFDWLGKDEKLQSVTSKAIISLVVSLNKSMLELTFIPICKKYFKENKEDKAYVAKLLSMDCLKLIILFSYGDHHKQENGSLAAGIKTSQDLKIFKFIHYMISLIVSEKSDKTMNRQRLIEEAIDLYLVCNRLLPLQPQTGTDDLVRQELTAIYTSLNPLAHEINPNRKLEAPVIKQHM